MHSMLHIGGDQSTKALTDYAEAVMKIMSADGSDLLKKIAIEALEKVASATAAVSGASISGCSFVNNPPTETKVENEELELATLKARAELTEQRLAIMLDAEFCAAKALVECAIPLEAVNMAGGFDGYSPTVNKSMRDAMLLIRKIIEQRPDFALRTVQSQEPSHD